MTYTNSFLLKKLGFDNFNELQTLTQKESKQHSRLLIKASTGSGKTLAFILAILNQINSDKKTLQCLIISPTRELAIQIKDVFNQLGLGLNINLFYGGRSIKKDLAELTPNSQIIIGTPGRLSDHMVRESFETNNIKSIVIDEYDKVLELGFEDDLREIVCSSHQLKNTTLVSATHLSEFPNYLNFEGFQLVESQEENNIESNLTFNKVKGTGDKTDQAVELLKKTNGLTLVFVSEKKDIYNISDSLNAANIGHFTFHGDLEQRERERELVKFKNSENGILLTSDLAARGIDVKEIENIIHFNLPYHEKEFTHRNGRTARMNETGSVFFFNEQPQHYTLPQSFEFNLNRSKNIRQDNPNTTLFIAGGKMHKISKGDVLGLLCKIGGLQASDVGNIQINSDCTFVGVPKNSINALIQKVNNQRLKKKKIRVYEI